MGTQGCRYTARQRGRGLSEGPRLPKSGGRAGTSEGQASVRGV